MNRFSRELGQTLRHHSRIFAYHYADSTGQWRPAEWFLASADSWGVLLAKSIEGDRFYLDSGWLPRERALAREIIEKGGSYLLAVEFRSEPGMTRGHVELHDASALIPMTETPGQSLDLDLTSCCSWTKEKGWNILVQWLEDGLGRWTDERKSGTTA